MVHARGGTVERVRAILDEASVMISGVEDQRTLEDLRVKYLGKKGLLTELIKYLGDLPAAERPKMGKAINDAKNQIQHLISDKQSRFEDLSKQKSLQKDILDITLPGRAEKTGKIHPISRVMNEVLEVFSKLGFSIAYGPDVETDYYNFEALNIPAHHPSRDMWSTLYVEGDVLLRTHTSPVQIRVMEKQNPPLAVVVPGRVYRRDADVTHSTVFHQVEGFLVDRDVTFGDLKGALTSFLHYIFGRQKKVRFRPSYFPFTEPSAEVDVQCVMCGGDGCRICKGTGWIEILGSGMIDPNVFKYVKYDPEKFSGFAFGLGIERVAMLKYGIDDIRLFYQNDLRFLRQF
ncbi:MAG: phenylalanine--tRNA ligase subunit alpha [Candidatus Margulisbacteria bacterium]|nr:phenylalanine--tRNA ligase subunit alpha [Candidatus Margulisiibacteriota bacterium]